MQFPTGFTEEEWIHGLYYCVREVGMPSVTTFSVWCAWSVAQHAFPTSL